jgi:hypothetical protein
VAAAVVGVVLMWQLRTCLQASIVEAGHPRCPSRRRPQEAPPAVGGAGARADAGAGAPRRYVMDAFAIRPTEIPLRF